MPRASEANGVRRRVDAKYRGSVLREPYRQAAGATSDVDRSLWPAARSETKALPIDNIRARVILRGVITVFGVEELNREWGRRCVREEPERQIASVTTAEIRHDETLLVEFVQRDPQHEKSGVHQSGYAGLDAAQGGHDMPTRACLPINDLPSPQERRAASNDRINVYGGVVLSGRHLRVCDNAVVTCARYGNQRRGCARERGDET